VIERLMGQFEDDYDAEAAAHGSAKDAFDDAVPRLPARFLRQCLDFATSASISSGI
jgi:hypothetical protein